MPKQHHCIQLNINNAQTRIPKIPMQYIDMEYFNYRNPGLAVRKNNILSKKF